MKGNKSSQQYYAQRTKALMEAQRMAARQTAKVQRTPAKKLFADDSDADYFYERVRHCDSAVHKQGVRRSDAEQIANNNFKRYLKQRQTATERVSKVQSKKSSMAATQQRYHYRQDNQQSSVPSGYDRRNDFQRQSGKQTVAAGQNNFNRQEKARSYNKLVKQSSGATNSTAVSSFTEGNLGFDYDRDNFRKGTNLSSSLYNRGSQGGQTDAPSDSIELLQGQLYFSTANHTPMESQSTKVINVDNSYLYEGYNTDFGPLTLNFVHKFIKEIDSLVSKHKKVVHHCSQNFKHQANGAFLMGCYLIVSQSWSINQIKGAFGDRYLQSLRPFRDAGVGPDDFPLSVVDCLKGMERAVQLGWYSKSNFDCFEFEQMLKLGDLSWVVPDQIIACASPQEPQYTRSTHVSNHVRPDDLIDSFIDLNVKGIVRLNNKLYNAGSFSRHSIKVHEMEFPDGSCPEDRIIQEFIQLTESYTSRGQAVAVHCRAGLGRTGTLIGLYIMHKFGFDARPLIAWMRICREGMVVGQQQQFLVRTQDRLQQIMRSAPVSNFRNTGESPVPKNAAARDNGYFSASQNKNNDFGGFNSPPPGTPTKFSQSSALMQTPQRQKPADRDDYSSAQKIASAGGSQHNRSPSATYSYRQTDMYDRQQMSENRSRYNESTPIRGRQDHMTQYQDQNSAIQRERTASSFLTSPATHGISDRRTSYPAGEDPYQNTAYQQVSAALASVSSYRGDTKNTDFSPVRKNQDNSIGMSPSLAGRTTDITDNGVGARTSAASSYSVAKKLDFYGNKSDNTVNAYYEPVNNRGSGTIQYTPDRRRDNHQYESPSKQQSYYDGRVDETVTRYGGNRQSFADRRATDHSTETISQGDMLIAAKQKRMMSATAGASGGARRSAWTAAPGQNSNNVHQERRTDLSQDYNQYVQRLMASQKHGRY